MRELSKYIKKLRGKMSIRQVAEKTGISNAYLSQLESGKRDNPHPEVLKKLAKFFGIPVVEFLKIAGYLDDKKTKEETYEQRIEKAFSHVINDPRFNTGSCINPGDLSLDVKKYVLKLYAHNVKKSLLFSRPFPSSTIVNKGIVKTLCWKTKGVTRSTYRSGNKLFARYRVQVTCIESEGEFDEDKIYYEGPKKGTEKITQTVTGEGEFAEDVTNFKGYETFLLIQATDNAVKNALPKIKGTNWASIVRPFGE